MAQTRPTTHSNWFYPMMALAFVVGLALGAGIYIWISMNATGRTRIPVFLLALPTIGLVALARVADEALVRRSARVGPGQQDASSATLQHPAHNAQPAGAGAAAGYAQVPPAGVQPAASPGTGYAPASYGSSYGYAQPAYTAQAGQAHQPAYAPQASGPAQTPPQAAYGPQVVGQVQPPQPAYTPQATGPAPAGPATGRHRAPSPQPGPGAPGGTAYGQSAQPGSNAY